jgi:hypothetical protein
MVARFGIAVALTVSDFKRDDDAQLACSRRLCSSFFFSSELPISVPRDMKNYLASWRLSADTGANARRSKVIDGPNRDDHLALCGSCRRRERKM